MTKTVKVNVNASVLTLKQQQKNEIAALTLQCALMQKLTTSSGFYDMYYKFLSNYNNKTEAFDYVNQMYCELFGRIRFENFSHFLHFLNLS